MSNIDFEKKDDPELNAFCTKKLLIPGWAGEVNDGEAGYIGEELTKNPRLRQAWGVRQFFGKRWRHISPEMAKTLCRTWAGKPPEGFVTPSRASPEKPNKNIIRREEICVANLKRMLWRARNTNVSKAETYTETSQSLLGILMSYSSP